MLSSQSFLLLNSSDRQLEQQPGTICDDNFNKIKITINHYSRLIDELQVDSFACLIKIIILIVKFYINRVRRVVMDGKMHRYMQRIQKIIYTPNRNPSPLRVTHSPLRCRTNQLDRYLKYELSTKMISSIIHKHHQQLIHLFFNLVRKSQHRQRQRVYKFVAIQNQKIKVDLAISAKIMISVLKDLTKKRYVQFMQELHVVKRIEIKMIDRTQSPLELRERRQTMKSAVVMGSTNRKSTKSYKQVSEWIDYAQSSKGQPSNSLEVVKKKIGVQTVLRIIRAIKIRNVEYGFRRIRRKAEVMQNQIQSRRRGSVGSSKLQEENSNHQMQRLRKQITILKEKSKQQKRSEKNQANNKLENNYLNRLTILGSAYFIYKKVQTLSAFKLLSLHFKQQQKNIRSKTYLLKKSQSIFSLSRILKAHLSKNFIRLRSFTQTKVTNLQRYKQLSRCLDHIYSHKKLQLDHFFWNKLGTPVIQSSPSTTILKNKLVELPLSLGREGTLGNEQNSNFVVKLNFYSVVDKMFRFILIVSKLLIPMKQAFLKIDLYASYSYRIEESLNFVSQKNMREAFQSIKRQFQRQQAIKNNHNSGTLMVITSRIIKQRLVEPFSSIKILAQSQRSNNVMLPVYSSIVEITHQFINDRNTKSQYSLDYWSNAKKQFLDQPQFNVEQEKIKPKKRLSPIS